MVMIPATYTVTLATLITTVYSELYDSKYDSFDIEPLVENDRILLSFTRCFVDEGPCTPDAKSFKKIIPEALETSCDKCTPKQKKLIKTVIRAVMEKHPEAWKKLVDKYDKDGKHKDNFNNFLKSDR